MKLLHHNSLGLAPLIKFSAPARSFALLKTKQNTHKKKGKLESFKKYILS